MPREHGEGGTFVETIQLDDVLEVFDTVDGPVVLSADVADQLDCSRETGRRKLEALYDRGDLARRKVSRRVIYWLPEDDTADVEVTAETEGFDTVDDTPPDTPPETTTAVADAPEGERPDTTPDTAKSDDALLQAVREYISDRPPKKRHAKEAVLDVFQLLRTNGTMKTKELKDEIHPKYADHYQDKVTMWNALDRYLKDTPGIEKGGWGEWTYAGDDVARETLDEALPTTGGTYDPSKENL